MNELIKDQIFPYFSSLLDDKDLINLRNDTRWAEMNFRLKNILSERDKNLNKSLTSILDSIIEKVQASRFEYMDTIKKCGFKSELANTLGKRILKQDTINLEHLLSIIDNHGWPTIDEVGLRGEQTIFLVIQHAPLQDQKKYLPLMERVALSGNSSLSVVAYLKDRV